MVFGVISYEFLSICMACTLYKEKKITSQLLKDLALIILRCSAELYVVNSVF